ncbi:MAG: hypothetical protein ACYSWX_14985 [Planctomycetota bacterium]|jgi:hypothetical protein
MKNLKLTPTAQRTVCPNHGHDLVPLHTVEGGARRVVGLTCPEPYCEHVQMLTREEARGFVARRRSGRTRSGTAAVGG